MIKLYAQLKGNYSKKIKKQQLWCETKERPTLGQGLFQLQFILESDLFLVIENRLQYGGMDGDNTKMETQHLYDVPFLNSLLD